MAPGHRAGRQQRRLPRTEHGGPSASKARPTVLQVLALEQLCCIKADAVPVGDRIEQLEARVADLVKALADSRRQAEQVLFQHASIACVDSLRVCTTLQPPCLRFPFLRRTMQ